MSAFPSMAAQIDATGSTVQLAECLARIVPFMDAVHVHDPGCDQLKMAIAKEYGASYDTKSDNAEKSLNVSSDWIIRLTSADRLDDRDAERIRPFLATQPVHLAKVSLNTKYSALVSNDGKAVSELIMERNSNAQAITIDVIVLSYAKTRAKYEMTQRCLESLHASERHVKFNIVVVETNSAAALRELGGPTPFYCERIIHPQEPFHYNKFLQFGFAQLQDSTAQALLIINNDLVFEAGFASHLLQGLEQFDSVTPWCPNYHERHFDPAQPHHVGFRTTMELCGWAIMFRKELLLRIAFESLFPDDFSFWYQDNYYGHQLERHGAQHALVTAAKVHHLYEQSHELIDPMKKHAMTRGAKEIYERKVAENMNQDGVLLTIAVPSIPERLNLEFPRIYQKLCQQAENKPVEVLALIDNKRSTLGAKRNALTAMAQGRYLVFCDDDDDVSDLYVDKLLNAIRANPGTDCIVFDVWVTINGSNSKLCKYGREFVDVEKSDAYYRRPNQICCFRTEIARLEKRDNLNWGEDSRWAAAILPHLRTETRINEVLYFYDCRLTETTCPHDETLASSAPEIIITIGVLSVPSRVGKALPKLIAKLSNQAQGKPVEILALVDNKLRTVGAKRNNLLTIAHGNYFAFIDDDDDIADMYLDCLLNAVTPADPDCVVFDAWVTHDGRGGRICRYGVEFEDHDHAAAYFRKPNHLCCVRTALAREIGFVDTSWSEDFQFAAALGMRIKKQIRVDRILYHYQFSFANSETCTAKLIEATKSNNIVRENVLVRPVFGFYHVATMNHWRKVVEEQVLKIKASGLYERSERIFVGVVGPEHESVQFNDPKFQVVHCSQDVNEAEFPTLSHLHDFCQHNRNHLVYYIHTKGVSHENDRCRDWRCLMEYFIILHYNKCIEQLASHDIAGVNWHPTPSPHYSGNFWWARSEYIANLPPLRQVEVSQSPSDRQACQMWVGSNPAVRAIGVHRSHVNHYNESYPRSKYAELQAVEHMIVFDRPSTWLGLENRFQDLLEPIGTIRSIVDIGVGAGFSLFSLATACPNATVVGVDPYGRQSANKAQRMSQHEGGGFIGSDDAESWVAQHLSKFANAILLRCTGSQAAELLGSDIDVVHIDSAHTFADVAEEYATWEPKLRSGGCILFHNTQFYPNDVGRFFNQLPGRKAEICSLNGLGAWYKPVSVKSDSAMVADLRQPGELQALTKTLSIVK